MLSCLKNMIIKGCRFYTSLAELAQDPNLTLGTSEEATLKVIDILDQRQKPLNTPISFHSNTEAKEPQHSTIHSSCTSSRKAGKETFKNIQKYFALSNETCSQVKLLLQFTKKRFYDLKKKLLSVTID